MLRDSQDDSSAEVRRIQLDLEGGAAEKKTLEGFLNQSISKADYQFMNERYDTAIAGLLQKLDAIEQRRKLDTQTGGAQRDIKAAIRKIVTEGKSDDFCGQLLDHMTVYADGRVEVVLKLPPSWWFSYWKACGNSTPKLRSSNSLNGLFRQYNVSHHR